jgi:WD40 repeat protein
LLSPVELGELIYCVLAYGDFVFLGRKSFNAEIAIIRLLNLNFVIGLDGHSNTVISLHLANNVLFSGSVDTTIIAWNPDTGQLLRKYLGHASYVWALKTVGQVLYSAGNDQAILKWNINDGTLIQKFPHYHINKITSLALNDDSIFSGSFDTEIVRWNLTTYQFIQVYKTSRLMLRSVVVWNDFVLSGGDESVVAIWDKSTDSIEPLSILSGHIKPINTMFISGDWLFTGSSDATVKQWEMIDLTQIGEFLGNSQLHLLTFRTFRYCFGLDG